MFNLKHLSQLPAMNGKRFENILSQKNDTLKYVTIMLAKNHHFTFFIQSPFPLSLYDVFVSYLIL